MTYNIVEGAAGRVFCKQEIIVNSDGSWSYIRDPIGSLFKIGWCADIDHKEGSKRSVKLLKAKALSM